MKTDKVKEKQNIDNLFNRCYMQLSAIGIPVAPRKKIILEMYPRLDEYAYCELLPDGKFLIQLPESCYRERGGKEETIRRILHELTHTCPKCGTHTGKFQEYRNIILDRLGYDIFMTVDDPTSTHLPLIFRIGPCPHCGSSVEYRKKNKRNLKFYEDITQLYAENDCMRCRYCNTPLSFSEISFFASDEHKKAVD